MMVMTDCTAFVRKNMMTGKAFCRFVGGTDRQTDRQTGIVIFSL